MTRDSTKATKTTQVAPKPARHQSEKLQRVLDTINGYESTLSLSAALSSLFMVWVVPAVVAIGISLKGGTSENPNLFRYSLALVMGVVTLSFLTAGVSIYWYSRLRLNVEKLGGSPKIRYSNVVIEIGKIAGFAGIVATLTNLVPPLRPFSGLGVAFLVASVGLVVPRALEHTARMLWQYSESPTNPLREPPQLVSAVAYSWFFGIGALAYHQILGLASDRSWGPAESFSIGFAGVAMATVGIGSAVLVSTISRRQEDRLLFLGDIAYRSGIDQSSVSSRVEVSEAWENSEGLVSHNFGA